MLRVVNVVGARPNFMKMAPICRQMRERDDVAFKLVHTGQHYDEAMSDLFFRELELPNPDVHLGVGSGGHGQQTGQIMMAFEEILQAEPPDLVVVVGDVNSTIACGLVAAKLGVRLAHVEAGLRSFDRSMPEEINRVLTDQISDYLFTTERTAKDNLLREGIGEDRIHFVGNVMIDTLVRCRALAAERPVLENLRLEQRGYILVTLHRPSNVDDPSSLGELIELVEALSRHQPILFPAHPRTRERLRQFDLESRVLANARVRLIEPLGYIDFLRCMDGARLVVTDSGGVQEETTFLGVPCVTARTTTERPATVTEGTNFLAGDRPQDILEAALRALREEDGAKKSPELWDGNAAERIVTTLITSELSRIGE